MVYTGTAAYKLTIATSDDDAIVSLDNIKGAIDTSDFLTTGSTSTLSQPVITKTADYTILSADRSKLIQANTTGGQFTLTLTAAATLGDGWACKVRDSGTANQFILAAVAAIAFEGSSFTKRAFQPGEAAEIICDGAGFKIVGYTPPLLASRSPGVITFVSGASSDPVAPTAGARYIVSPGYGSYATGDIIEANGTSFNKYTPPTDCGWLAYEQSSNFLYQFQGSAWVPLTASSAQAIAGVDNAAFMTALSTRAAVPARAYNEYLLSEDITIPLPYDDTIPQNGEGVEKLSATITPKTTSSRVRVTFHALAGTSGSSTIESVAALFQDSIADALIATSSLTTATQDQVISFQFEHSPATTSLVTYKVRVGPGSAGTMRLNGTSAARKFGGVARATLVLEEILV